MNSIHTQLELSERLEQPQGRIAIGTMHVAKELGYKTIAVMASDKISRCRADISV